MKNSKKRIYTNRIISGYSDFGGFNGINRTQGV